MFCFFVPGVKFLFSLIVNLPHENARKALTLISENDVPDSLYDSVHKHFDEKEIVALSIAIVVINGRNRLSIGFLTAPAPCKPQ